MSQQTLIESRLPIVGAPMAGGATTVALARAVVQAGGFAFLAGGYRSAEALADQVRELRGSVESFGVNLFVPGENDLTRADYDEYAERIRPEADVLDAALAPEPRIDRDAWEAKLELLTAEPVAVVSLTFGLPPREDIARLRAAGSAVLMSVTTPDEARAAADAGVDGLVVQGPFAGGHSATFDPRRAIEAVDTADLVAAIRAAVALPVVAAGGGVDGPAAAKAVLDAGAEAVAIGTLLLRTDESGASQTHKDALADPRFTETTLTHAFTGRPARGLRNGFVDRHELAAPFGYPQLHHLTRELRAAAGRLGDADRLHLWAGTGFRQAATGPAARVVETVADGL